MKWPGLEMSSLHSIQNPFPNGTVEIFKVYLTPPYFSFGSTGGAYGAFNEVTPGFLLTGSRSLGFFGRGQKGISNVDLDFGGMVIRITSSPGGSVYSTQLGSPLWEL